MNKATLKRCVLMGCLASVSSTVFAAEIAAVSPTFDGTAAAPDTAGTEPMLPLSAANGAAINTPSSNSATNTPNETLVPANRALQQSVLDSGLVEPNGGYDKGNPFAINRFHVDFQVTVGAQYDDNIYVTNRNKRSGFEFSISPMVTVTLGDYETRTDNYLALAYQPTYVYYPDYSGLNAFENQVLLDSQLTFNRLVIGGQFRLDSRSGQSAETINDESVGRVDRTIYDGLLRGEYRLSEKTSVETELEWLDYDYKNRIDSTEYTARLFLNYLVAPKIKVGPGYAIGYTDVQDAPGQVSQQALIKATYAPTEKLTFDARAGVEFRHYNGGGGESTNPVFSLGASYQPFVDTRLDLEAYRRQRASADERGQNFTGTGVSLALSQKFLQKFTLRIASGVEYSDYEDAVSGLTSSGGRQDTFYFGRVGVSYDFREWLSAEVYYLYRKNDSNADSRSFSQNITGLQMVFKF